MCSCHFSEEGCLEEDTRNTTCKDFIKIFLKTIDYDILITGNCDAQALEMMTDLGTIRNKTALPIKQLQFGGLKYDLQQVVFGLYSRLVA